MGRFLTIGHCSRKKAIVLPIVFENFCGRQSFDGRGQSGDRGTTREKCGLWYYLVT